MHGTTGALLVLVCAAPLGGQVELPRPSAAAPAFAPSRFTGLFVDAPDETGAIWARGTTYKFGFEHGRARYVPHFGSLAPRNFPIEIELRSISCGGRMLPLDAAASPRTDGARIFCERGGVTEIWDLAPETAEQSFVLAEPMGPGEIVLQLALRTELELRSATSDELVFGRTGLGEVRYGEALAIDARGARTPLALELEGDALVLRVHAACAANATYPLIVDPVLRTFAADASAGDTTEPDVAYDSTLDVWLVVCREAFSQSDGDIKCMRWSGDGTTLLDTVYVESSSGNTHSPSVAGNDAHDVFLIAHVAETGGDRIVLRERSAGSTSQASSLGIRAALSTQDYSATDVGGASTSTDRFLVVWKEASNVVPTSSAVLRGGGYPLGGPFRHSLPISGGAACNAVPRVSKDSGPHQRWIITWTSASASGCLGGEVHFALVDHDANFVQVDTPLSGSQSGLDVRPAAAGDGETFFVVWQKDDAFARTQSDIFGARIARTQGAWSQIGNALPLTQLEPIAGLSADQTGPSIAFDGCRYAYAYSQSSGGGAPRPFAATFADRGTSLDFHEGHLALSNAANGVAHSSVKIAMQGNGGGVPGLGLAVWQQIGSGGRDLGAALLDVRDPAGGVAVLATRCPNRLTAARIALTGVPALGREVQLQLSNLQGAPLLMLGLPTTPFALCTNAIDTCEIGVALPPIAVLAAASVSFRVPCDLLLIGGTVAAQGIDVGGNGGCPAALFGIALRVTDTLNVTIQ